MAQSTATPRLPVKIRVAALVLVVVGPVLVFSVVPLFELATTKRVYFQETTEDVVLRGRKSVKRSDETVLHGRYVVYAFRAAAPGAGFKLQDQLYDDGNLARSTTWDMAGAVRMQTRSVRNPDGSYSTEYHDSAPWWWGVESQTGTSALPDWVLDDRRWRSVEVK